MQLADCVSVNLEMPSTERLENLPRIKFSSKSCCVRCAGSKRFRKSVPAYKFWNGRYPSTVTQFVAGGSDESDLELLNTTDWLMKNVRLKRAYFSAFHPVYDTPLENKPAVNPMREHRLYQASFYCAITALTWNIFRRLQQTTTFPFTPIKTSLGTNGLIHSPIEINMADRTCTAAHSRHRHQRCGCDTKRKKIKSIA